MQNHISNLITVQIEKKMDDYVAREEINNKKDSESSGADSSSSPEYKKRPHSKASKKENFLNCQTQAAIVKAIVKAIR